MESELLDFDCTSSPFAGLDCIFINYRFQVSDCWSSIAGLQLLDFDCTSSPFAGLRLQSVNSSSPFAGLHLQVSDCRLLTRLLHL
ncbi:hypothetical protein L2E82_44667 [Cichorium intybus]|uniref:Uncharacterized protein n=1 Tax=Cichorium intybus TaxID=13427 RepID=A0ACB8ZQF5_CICIN|nr:hypothetical protein L2E82_44667 [Cichorium intybus]